MIPMIPMIPMSSDISVGNDNEGEGRNRRWLASTGTGAGAGIVAALIVIAVTSFGEGSTFSLLGVISRWQPTNTPAVEASLASNDYLLYATFSQPTTGRGVRGVVRMTALNGFPYRVRLSAVVSPAEPTLHLHFDRRGLVYPGGFTSMTAVTTGPTPAGNYQVTVRGTGRDGTVRRASAVLHIP